MSRTYPIQIVTPYYRIFSAMMIALSAGVFVYRGPIAEVMLAVIKRQDSSHGALVPFLSLVFIWARKDALRDAERVCSWSGMILVLLGILPIVLCIDNFQLSFAGFIVFLGGVTLTVLGQEIFRQIGFPLFFLIALAPLPESLYNELAHFSRTVALGGAVKIISIFGIPYLRDGWMIHLPNAVLRVAIPCSGIRYLISYFVLGVAYAWLCKTTLKGKLLTLSFVIPVSLFASIMRLTSIFTLTYAVSPRVNEHWPHIFISWTVFGVFLLAGIAGDQYVSYRWRYNKPARSGMGDGAHG